VRGQEVVAQKTPGWSMLSLAAGQQLFAYALAGLGSRAAPTIKAGSWLFL